MSTAETDKTKVNALRRRKQSEPASIKDPAPTERSGATKRLNVEVPANLHTFLKMKAARDDTEVRRLTVAALLEVYGPEFVWFGWPGVSAFPSGHPLHSNTCPRTAFT